MNETGTRTNTFTVADIRKVVENFAADFSMMAQATGLRTREDVSATSTDLRKFAENGYISSITLTLRDKDDKVLRIARYEVSDCATGWQSDSPGNNLWPRTPGGSLRIIAHMTPAWTKLNEEQKEAYLDANDFYGSWGATSENDPTVGLVSNQGQKYASNGYGWKRTNFTQT